VSPVTGASEVVGLPVTGASVVGSSVTGASVVGPGLGNKVGTEVGDEVGLAEIGEPVGKIGLDEGVLLGPDVVIKIVGVEVGVLLGPGVGVGLGCAVGRLV